MLPHVNIQYRVHISLNDGTDLHSFLYVSPSLPQTGSLLLEHLLIFLLLQFSIKLSLLHTLRCSKIFSSSITSRGTQPAPPPQQLQAQPVLKRASQEFLHRSSQHSHKSVSKIVLGICKWGAVTEGLCLAVFFGKLKIRI